MKPTHQTQTKPHPLTNKYIAALSAITCSVLWGSAFPVLKISYQEMQIAAGDLGAKVVLAGMRFGLAAVLLFAMAAISRMSLRTDLKNWPGIAVSGFLAISLQYFFFYNGLANTSGMKAAILNSCGTFFIFVLAHFSYANDRLNLKKVIGLATGLAGILLVNYGKSFTLDFRWQGEGFLILAGLAGAAANIMSKNISGKIQPLVLTAWQLLLGSFLLLLAGYTVFPPPAMIFTPKALILLLYGAFLSAASYSLWYSILKYNKAGEISVYMFIIPISGAFLSALFVPGERLTLHMLAALCLVAAGIITVNYKKGEGNQ